MIWKGTHLCGGDQEPKTSISDTKGFPSWHGNKTWKHFNAVPDHWSINFLFHESRNMMITAYVHHPHIWALFSFVFFHSWTGPSLRIWMTRQECSTKVSGQECTSGWRSPRYPVSSSQTSIRTIPSSSAAWVPMRGVPDISRYDQLVDFADNSLYIDFILSACVCVCVHACLPRRWDWRNIAGITDRVV